MENNTPELERILQEGISSYAAGEALTGLEERIIARVRMTKSSRENTAGVWAVLAMGLAVLVLCGSVYLRVGRTQSRPLRIVSEAKTATLEETPSRPDEIKTSRPKRHRNPVVALPKQPVFPTPSPLTVQERMLVAMVKQDPEGTAQIFDSLRKRGSEPLEIAPLIISPLETGEGQ
jgi:hypothetical protein